MSELPAKPAVPNLESQPFWDATAEGRIPKNSTRSLSHYASSWKCLLSSETIALSRALYLFT